MFKVPRLHLKKKKKLDLVDLGFILEIYTLNKPSGYSEAG